MFAFHKPRVYRSAEGCCICRAKSSSSRFTDSRKYEQDSMKCFDLKYPRHGEICNACVLLVKRFKRLPVGSTRHWGHVVDARAGPGTKSISKYKKSRDDAENTSNNLTSRCTQNSKSLLAEKYSKIYKKNKHKIATGGELHSIHNTLETMDSDYEDVAEVGETCEVRESNPHSNSSSVQFQTQTRASRKRTNSIHCRKDPLKTGSKRRKSMPPKRNRSTLKLFNDHAQFFDESEWQERKSCCGLILLCPKLSGTILFDTKNFKACSEHQCPQGVEIKDNVKTQNQSSIRLQRAINATRPTVEQTSAPSTAVHSIYETSLPTPVPVINTNSTPVLKKHHLFFKRQSESFPQVDLAVNNSIINSSNKTEFLGAITTAPVIIKNSTNSTNPKSTTPTVPHPSEISNGNSSSTLVSTPLPLPLAINTTNISAISSISPSSATSVSAHMPRHSTAKVTTISPPLSTTNLTGGNRLLHKIKTGKILKNSQEKIGVTTPGIGRVSPAAVERIKGGDLQELKPVIRSVPKSYILTKPTINGQKCKQYNPAGSPPTSACANSAASSSSTVAPKFSDNSSDSGFDENLLDRKSASPLREDIGNVKPVISLSTGFSSTGPNQTLLLACNESAARTPHMQNMSRMVTSNSGVMHQNYQHQSAASKTGGRVGSAKKSLKISQVKPTTISVGSTNNSIMGAHIKTTATATATPSIRAIYNNNTIQHENGVTTIVPASSLAATTQTAAMNALAPSTVTITPAPIHHLGGAAVSLTKKLATSGLGVNLIATNGTSQSNILHTVTNTASHLINHTNSALMQQHHNTTTNMNQKIILLKTAGPTKYNNFGSIGSNGNVNNVKTTIGMGICKN
ncbi:mucin-5AC [Anastrepha obliqua]|uniref:mucin-5AC n=1 Tax=Anastrepha obliqua TaxID=95512 RepID=UPI0024092D07|nr:mucin-5AC [Anastrepha obliqua]XP_054727216.1 mucin-5AC [Anastrepha obliqua]XP_054727217.1 mucin-5AC [Anastrepha obliqua]